jgi:Fur family ferric uptake transcriptional regulator
MSEHLPSERPSAEPTGHSDLHGEDVEGALEAALDVLRELGERITAPRVAVLRVLAVEHALLTAERVSAALPDVHRATVFRTLDKLAALGLVSASRSDEGTGYHLAVVAAGHDHLHARCQRCGRMEALPSAIFRDAARNTAAATDFQVNLRASIFVGICATCAAA